MRISSKKIFYCFVSVVIASLIFQFVFLSSKTQDNESKVLFVKLSGMPDLAFNSNVPYLRHRSLSVVNDLYSLHPGIEPLGLGTFIQQSSLKAR